MSVSVLLSLHFPERPGSNNAIICIVLSTLTSGYRPGKLQSSRIAFWFVCAFSPPGAVKSGPTNTGDDVNSLPLFYRPLLSYNKGKARRGEKSINSLPWNEIHCTMYGCMGEFFFLSLCVLREGGGKLSPAVFFVFFNLDLTMHFCNRRFMASYKTYCVHCTYKTKWSSNNLTKNFSD